MLHLANLQTALGIESSGNFLTADSNNGTTQLYYHPAGNTGVGIRAARSDHRHGILALSINSPINSSVITDNTRFLATLSAGYNNPSYITGSQLKTFVGSSGGGGDLELTSSITPGDIGTDTGSVSTLVGSSTFAARADHNHQVDYGETSDMYSGSSTDNNQGSVDEIARIDHRHAGGSGGGDLSGLDLAIVFGDSNLGLRDNGVFIAGSGIELFKTSSSTSTTNIVQLTSTTSGTTGTSTSAARADHRHGLGTILSNSTPTASTTSSGTPGTSSSVSRSNHRHQAPDGGGGGVNYGTTSNLSWSSIGFTGSSASVSRSDHRHGFGTNFGFTSAAPPNIASTGTAGSSTNFLSRSNHSHGITNTLSYSGSTLTSNVAGISRSVTISGGGGSSGFTTSDRIFNSSFNSLSDGDRIPIVETSTFNSGDADYIEGYIRIEDFVDYLDDEISDIRIKRNIEDLPKGLDKLNSLRPVKYNTFSNSIKTVSDRIKYGFIAQELIDVLPDVVRTEDKDCPDCQQGLECRYHNNWKINYNSIVTMLVKSVQELSAQNNELSNRITELETVNG